MDPTTTEALLNALSERGPGLGGVIMLKELNPLDENTPLETPLIVVSTSREDEDGNPLYILQGGPATEKAWSGTQNLYPMRQCHPHTVFFPRHAVEAVLMDCQTPCNCVRCTTERTAARTAS